MKTDAYFDSLSHRRDANRMAENSKLLFLLHQVVLPIEHDRNKHRSRQSLETKRLSEFIQPSTLGLVHVIFKFWVPRWAEQEAETESDRGGENEREGRKNRRVKGQETFLDDKVVEEYQKVVNSVRAAMKIEGRMQDWDNWWMQQMIKHRKKKRESREGNGDGTANKRSKANDENVTPFDCGDQLFGDLVRDQRAKQAHVNTMRAEEIVMLGQATEL